MAWRKLHRSDLDVICGEFGIDCGKHLKKAEVIRAMEASRDDEEIVELWEDIKKKREDQERERHKEEQERVRERERKHELDKKRLDLEIARATTSGGATLNAPVSKAPKIKDLLNPFKMGEDIGLFLVNFERSCEGKFERELWAQMLLTVLPCEAADVLARLPRDEANDYDIVKRALLKRYRLSAEAFRRRFRNSSKRSSESFADFAYSLRCNLTEWLKGEGAFGDHDKVVELICTEQFLNVLSDEARLWVLDQPGEKNLERTAELAEEYTMRREEIRERNKPAKKPYRENSKQSERNSYAPIAPGGTNEKDTHGESTMSGRAGKEKEQDKNRDRAFEAKKPIVCYRCNEPGHLAVGCRKEKLVFSLFNHTDENMRLLEPYLREMTVNGQNCRVLRDSAATMDVIHPSYVPADGFTGDCAWIRQVAQEDSVCLPVAKVLIKGPFGELETEAAVSQSLPKQYGYLFSNHSEDLLRKKGLSFGEHTVHALTRSKAKEIAKELGSSQNREAQAPDETRADANQENVPSDGESSFKSSSEASEEVNLLSVLPCMGGFLELSKVSPEVIAAEQAEDKTLQKLSDMVEEGVETVSRAQYVSTLDLTRGYWQVPMTERASKYAAFISPLGTFRPLVMSFGLKNAPFCFSRLMDRVLAGAENYAVPYLDDIAVFSDSWEKHLSHLRDVLTRLRNAGLTVKAEKCQLGQAEVEYLGHIVGRGCRRPHEVKLAAIENYPRPVTKTDIRAFLGLTGYYQHYIPKYSQIASPLTDSLRKGEPVKVQWDELRESSFQALKAALTSQPILRAPDYNRPFVLQCDASERGLGAVLSQRDESREEHPVLFISRKLSTREEAYSTSEKECACLVWAIYKLRCYLAGSPFLVETDHCPLSWLRNMSPKNGRLLRWSLALQEHNFEIRYKKGRDNGNADALSRGFL
ncbi:uncharacterized protein LOC142775721 [Rhipicephalus microplus]|uniref:uncharacterized protein LOC142775721 n=1 Tax=Rhipicephalus microplus TaxID=6941 RepID=UPI003F6B561D